MLYRGPENVDELLAELHQSEAGAPSKFRGDGRRLQTGAAQPASSDVSDMMARMEARLNRLSVEQGSVAAPAAAPASAATSTRSDYPRHGRRALGAVAGEPQHQLSHQPKPSCQPARRRGSGDISAGSELAELSALEGAAREAERREAELRRQISALSERLQLPADSAATAPAAAAAPAAAREEVRVRRQTGPDADGGALSAVMSRRIAMLKRQAPARAAAIDSLENELRRLRLQLQQQQQDPPQWQQDQLAGAPAAAGPAAVPAPASSSARLLLQLRRLNDALGASEVGCAAVAPGVHGLVSGTSGGAGGGVGGTGAAAGPRACVPCSVFADGVMLYRGPFRPWPDAAPFVADVMAGHLPYELKARHPAGVVFEPLLDFRHQTHAQGVAAARGSGGGGSGSGGAVVRDLSDVHAGAGVLAPEARLLDKLPKSVLRNGAVVPIRDEVAALVGRGGGVGGGGLGGGGDAVPDPRALEDLRAASLRRFS